MLKIAVVGPEEEKWTEEQKVKAKFWIKHILTCMKVANKCVIPLNRDTVEVIDNSSKNVIYPITLVSGHCPKGGVDIWAEEIAKELGCYNPDYIFTPEVNQWEDSHWMWNPDRPPETSIGYKSRNIKIAKACDILYCIVPYKWDDFTKQPPYDSTTWCKHCKVWKHPSNGGCWTMQYAKKLGKETHLVVIE
jgi:hypothetical protein